MGAAPTRQSGLSTQRLVVADEREKVGMSTVVIKRAARRPAPEIPTGELAVDPPPEIPQAVGGRWQQAMMVLPMLGGSVAMAMMMGRGGGGAFSYVVGGLFGISSLAMLATSFG